MSAFADVRDHTGASEGKHYKTTLFRSDRLLLGLNCLEPGQTQPIHTHSTQDKFYFVVEGRGAFTVGDVVEARGAGSCVWAPAGVVHGVRNDAETRLVLLVGIAPSP